MDLLPRGPLGATLKACARFVIWSDVPAFLTCGQQRAATSASESAPQASSSSPTSTISTILATSAPQQQQQAACRDQPAAFQQAGGPCKRLQQLPPMGQAPMQPAHHQHQQASQQACEMPRWWWCRRVHAPTARRPRRHWAVRGWRTWRWMCPRRRSSGRK